MFCCCGLEPNVLPHPFCSSWYGQLDSIKFYTLFYLAHFLTNRVHAGCRPTTSGVTGHSMGACPIIKVITLCVQDETTFSGSFSIPQKTAWAGRYILCIQVGMCEGVYITTYMHVCAYECIQSHVP